MLWHVSKLSSSLRLNNISLYVYCILYTHTHCMCIVYITFHLSVHLLMGTLGCFHLVLICQNSIRATIRKKRCHRLSGQSICHSSGGGKSKVNVSAKLVSPEAASMACRQLPSLCVLTWPFVCDCASLGLSLYCSKGTGQPHPYDLILLNCFLKASSPDVVTLEVRASVYEFGGDSSVHNIFLGYCE